MKLFDDTGQARDVALLALAPDLPVKVDTAMKVARLEYADPLPGSPGWWRKVRGLAGRA